MFDLTKGEVLNNVLIGSTLAGNAFWDLPKVPINEMWIISTWIACEIDIAGARSYLGGVVNDNTFTPYAFLSITNNNAPVALVLPVTVAPGEIIRHSLVGGAAAERLRFTVTGMIYRLIE